MVKIKERDGEIKRDKARKNERKKKDRKEGRILLSGFKEKNFPLKSIHVI